MCLACSPYCGRCRPAPRVSLSCPACTALNDLTREQCIDALGYRARGRAKPAEDFSVFCVECGTDLKESIARAVKPLDCKYSGIVCGYPCGRYRKEFFPGDLVCEKQVPLGRIGSIPEVSERTRAALQSARKYTTSIMR